MTLMVEAKLMKVCSACQKGEHDKCSGGDCECACH